MATARVHLLRQCEQHSLIFQALHVLVGVRIEGLHSGGQQMAVLRLLEQPDMNAFLTADARGALFGPPYYITFRLLFHSSSSRSKKAPRLPHTCRRMGGREGTLSEMVHWSMRNAWMLAAGQLQACSIRARNTLAAVANYTLNSHQTACACLGRGARLWLLNALVFGRCVSEANMPVFIQQDLMSRRFDTQVLDSKRPRGTKIQAPAHPGEAQKPARAPASSIMQHLTMMSNMVCAHLFQFGTVMALCMPGRRM